MRWLEDTIEAFAPAWAAKRAFFRVQLDAARGYDAAKGGRRQNSWSRPSTSATVEIGLAGTALRNTARDLVRNNAYGKKAKRIYVANLVGAGIVPTAKTGSKERDKKIDRAFKSWCGEADAAARLDFFGVQALVAGALFESGEALARFRDLEPGPALRIQVLEPDHLDSARYALAGGAAGSYVFQGIELDELGRALAYWLFPRHPGDSVNSLRGQLQSIRVPAEGVAHVFAAHMGRPGQIRGASEYAAVAQRMNDLAEYDEATLVGKKIAACFAAFIKRSGSATSPLAGKAATTDGQNRRIETLAPGMFQYLQLDEDITFANPPASTGYREYTMAQVHAIAAGLGVMYEQISGDLSQVNYSSYRAGQNDFRRAIEMDQWLMLIPMFCEPTWRRFIDRQVLAGIVRPAADGSHYGVEWACPRWESVDPYKDAQADREDVRSGFVDLRDQIARRGNNPDEVLRKIAETNKLSDELGLVLDTDPRKTNARGSAMPPDDVPAAAVPGQAPKPGATLPAPPKQGN